MIKNKFLLSAILAVSSLVSMNYKESLAKVEITPYTLSGMSSSGNSNSPSAYKISYSSDHPAKDRFFPNGTILYKQSHRGVTYYSPKPPLGSVEASGASADYVNWGFWDFAPNRRINDNGQLRSKYYYSQIKLTKNYQPRVHNANGDVVVSSKTLTAGSVFDTLYLTYESGVDYFFIDAVKYGITDAHNGIARIPKSVVTTQGDFKQVYFSEFDNKNTSYVENGSTKYCHEIYYNFKPYATQSTGLDGARHDKLTQSGLTSSPSSLNSSYLSPCALGGKNGEWRFLGLDSQGAPIVNPYFPSDWISFLGGGSIRYYDWTANLTSKPDFISEYGGLSIYDTSYKTQKINIIQKLYDKGYSIFKIGSKTQTLSVTEFANRISLRTHPTEETAVFVGAKEKNGMTRSFVFEDSTVIKDLYVAEVRVKDGNNIVARGTRTGPNNPFTVNYNGTVNKGGYYTVEVILGNGSNNRLSVTNLYASMGITKNKAFNLDLSINQTVDSRKNYVSGNSLGGSIGATSNAIVFPLHIPENETASYFDIYGFVGVDHTGNDNMNYCNDTGGVRINLAPPLKMGDIQPVSIELFDTSGTLVYKIDANNNVSSKKAIIPGNSYKIKYTAKYAGTSIYNKVWRNNQWVNDSPRTSTIPFSYSIQRKIGNNITDESKTWNDYFLTSSNSKSIPMTNGTQMYFTTGYMDFQHPYLKTTLNISCTDSIINQNTSNDSLTAILNDNFDISISNLKVNPSTEYIQNNNQKITYSVSYDATLTVPSYVNGKYETSITTSISINGQTVTVTDHLKTGLNANISHTIPNISVSNGAIRTEVVLNSNLTSYETDTNNNNNRGSVSSTVSMVYNPFLGKSTDTASNAYNGSTTSPDKGGSANNNCLIPRTKNTYNASYKIHTWTSTPVTYTNFYGNNTVSYNKYSTVSESTATAQNSEEFIIKDILFKSKYTKDNNLGNNGWVSMINSKDSIIKAGYGFELKVIVEYKTNALLNNPTSSISSTGGTTVTNLASGINVIPDIFVELPGSNSTRKILSTTGQSGTSKGLVVTKTKDNVVTGTGTNKMQVSEWEYTIKPSKTVGINSTSRIYIPENLKNGDYKISIYTPPVTGVSSLAESTKLPYSALCDRKDVYVKVKGSATDDLNSHTTQ